MEIKDLAAKIDGISQTVADNIKSAKDEINGNVDTKLKEAKNELQDEISNAKGQAQKAASKAEELEKKFNIVGQFGERKQKSDLQEKMEAKKADIASIKDNMKGSVSFEVKAAATMTLGNYTGGSVGLTSFDNEFVRVVRRQPFLRQIVSVRPIGTGGVSWAEQANPDGGAGMTAEGSAKTQADFDIVERRETPKKITSFIKVSKEALEDLAWLMSEINQELIELVELKLDDQVLAGDNTGNNLKGILQYAPTFSVAGSPLALGVDFANNFDVIRAAAWQIANSGKGRFVPNYVALNPVDAAAMDMTKNTQGTYVIPPFVTSDGATIYGLKVIENVGVTAGNFLVGDFTKDILGIRENLTINIGYDQDDFTKNLVTVLAEMRAYNYIKTNNTTAFVQGTFSTAKTAMETA